MSHAAAASSEAQHIHYEAAQSDESNPFDGPAQHGSGRSSSSQGSSGFGDGPADIPASSSSQGRSAGERASKYASGMLSSMRGAASNMAARMPAALSMDLPSGADTHEYFAHQAHAATQSQLHKVLGWKELISLGVGCTIGAGTRQRQVERGEMIRLHQSWPCRSYTQSLHPLAAPVARYLRRHWCGGSDESWSRAIFVLCCVRHCVRSCGTVLQRAGRDGSLVGLRLLVRARQYGPDGGLDHRVGPHARVRSQRGIGGAGSAGSRAHTEQADTALARW